MFGWLISFVAYSEQYSLYLQLVYLLTQENYLQEKKKIKKEKKDKKPKGAKLTGYPKAEPESPSKKPKKEEEPVWKWQESVPILPSKVVLIYI